MGARGYNIAQEGHTVLILSPKNITGGATGTPFSMKNAAKANILIALGAQAAAGTKIILNACDDNSGTNPVAIPFDLFAQETAGNANDVLGARVAVPAAGYTPSANSNIFYVLHVQADQLPAGKPWVQLSLTNGANANFAAAFAVLSGVRFQGESNQTATA